MFNVQSSKFKMQKYIFRKRKHHFLCYFLLNNPQKPKVPLDPKFKVGANLRVSPQSSKFKVPLDPKGRFHSEAEKECSEFIV